MNDTWIIVGISMGYLLLSLVMGILPGLKVSKSSEGYVAGDREGGAQDPTPSDKAPTAQQDTAVEIKEVPNRHQDDAAALKLSSALASFQV